LPPGSIFAIQFESKFNPSQLKTHLSKKSKFTPPKIKLKSKQFIKSKSGTKKSFIAK